MLTAQEQERRRELVKRRKAYIKKRVLQLVQLGRQTFYREDLTAEQLKAIPEAETLGTIVSNALEWEPTDVLMCAQEMFSDSNLHTLNKQFSNLLEGKPAKLPPHLVR